MLGRKVDCDTGPKYLEGETTVSIKAKNQREAIIFYFSIFYYKYVSAKK